MYTKLSTLAPFSLVVFMVVMMPLSAGSFLYAQASESETLPSVPQLPAVNNPPPPKPNQPPVPDQPVLRQNAPSTGGHLEAPPSTTDSRIQQPQMPRTAAPLQGSGRNAQVRKDEVTFFFDDADIFEVAQTVFGEVLRVNYIIDPKVKGRVNFRTVTPIHRDRILSVMEIILRLNGIAVVEEAGLYRIIPISDIVKEPAPILFGKTPDSVELKGTAVVQVIPLEYIGSTEMSKVLTPLLTQGGAILDIPKKNFLIIADTDANVKRLLGLITMFDENTLKDTSQPKIYIYALQNSKADHVSRILQQVFLGTASTPARPATPSPTTTTSGGTTLPVRPAQPVQTIGGAAGQGEPIVSPGTKIFPDEVTNSIVIFASPVDYVLIQNTIKQIDTIPRQVMIEALVASVTLTDNLRFGLQWSLDTDLKMTNIKPFKNNVNIGGPLSFNAPIDSSVFSYSATASDPNKVRLAIQALAEDNNAKVLSSPHILVSDNREAKIQVGEQVPIATSQTTNTGTTPAQITTTIQYKDTGTILKVKPQINDSGLISLEISQEVSTVSTQKVLGTDQFVISKREVATNLVAQDGQTIVIGGLINETASKGRAGIPFLSKIPLLGFLFGSTVDDKTRTELIIMITPRVVRNQNDAATVTADYMKKLRGVSKELGIEERSINAIPQ